MTQMCCFCRAHKNFQGHFFIDRKIAAIVEVDTIKHVGFLRVIVDTIVRVDITFMC